MKKHPQRIAAVVIGTLLCGSSAFALHSGLVGAGGESIFTKAFIQDYESAQKSVDTLKSAEPLVALLSKYLKPEEQAELELSIGIVYNQRTGVVDPAKAVAHLTRALEFNLPERTCIEIWMWRGGSYEQLKKYPEALRDYIRGLLTCSYRDLAGGWPELLAPTVPIYINSDDPENPQRVKDYQRYRHAIDLKRFLLMQRYYLIEAVKRLQADGAIADKALDKAVKELSPDASRIEIISGLIKSENKRPWP
jgi:tetratricopeptide (TPR) repeat protein